MFRRTISTLPRTVSVPLELIGATGKRYTFKSLLQSRPDIGRVWTATYGQNQYVLKDIPEPIYENFHKRIIPQLLLTKRLRLPVEHVPDQRILVYEYMTEDLLSFFKKQIPKETTKRILKASLEGIAALHEGDVVHLDIKPDNFMLDYRLDGDNIVIDQIKLTDLENAARLPKGKAVKGFLAGNSNWRSPEAHYKGELTKPTDIFSFGAVLSRLSDYVMHTKRSQPSQCIYAVLGRVIFGPDEDMDRHIETGALPDQIRLQRQVCYFGNEEGFQGLRVHISDDTFNCEILGMLWEDRNADYIPYKPFGEWPEITTDEIFVDLMKKMMHLDPRKRITARDALEHAWFANIES